MKDKYRVQQEKQRGIMCNVRDGSSMEWDELNWSDLCGWAYCFSIAFYESVNQRTVCVFVGCRLSDWLTDSLTACLSLSACTSRSLSVRICAPLLCLSVYRVPVCQSVFPSHHYTLHTLLLVGLVSHDRQKCVPAQISNVDVEHLKSQWNKGEVDQLEGWPHQAVCTLWENRE